MRLHCRADFRDSFLHVNGGILERLMGPLKVPIVQLAGSNGSVLMWAVGDESIEVEGVHLSATVAEELGFKHHEKVSILLAPVKIAELKKAVVLVDREDHWMLLNKNRDSIESIILDQIRLMKRHQRLPIWFGDQVIWIKLESGGEYGLLGFDTELIVEQATEAVQVEEIEMSLIPGLRDGFYWKKSAGLYRIREETVRIQADPQIPEGFLQVPYYLLEHVFALPPKSKINCERVVKTKLEFPHQWTISHSAATNTFNSLNSFDFESIMLVAEGTAVIGSTEARKNIQYKEVKPIQFDELATFLMKKPKIALIEGDAGVGKTIQIQQAIMALNWRHEFPLIIKYYDMLSETPIIGNERFRTLYILDHFDEYFEEQEEAEPENRQKFLKIAKQINHATQTLDHSVAIIVRSCRNLTKYMRGCGMLSFDASFTCETVKNTSMTLIDSPAFDHVLGSQATLLRLKCLLFNPIKYEHIYAANGMKRQGGVLIHGPSGCGKTFIAESFLKGHGIPFIRVRGPELLDKYVGASEAAVRDVFSRARKQRPCVILFDEFDSLVPQRGSNHSGVTDRIVNQFLTELDGTGDRSGVYVLATTSRPELIDKAILRPGRVDARIEMAFPSHEELREAFEKTLIREKDLILGYLSDVQSFSWADFKALNACSGNEDVIKLLHRLEKTTLKLTESIVPNKQRLSLA